ncbi:hypothetical protein GCM10027446_24970 [Angustibacter peucedani]
MRRLLEALRGRTAAGDDGGFAMVTVLGIGTVMTALMLVSLAYAAQVSPQARRDQNWNAALAAAQAGVDDYVSRLNKADSYALSVDCSNIAMKGPNSGANTCGWNSSTPAGWQTVKGGDATKGVFHYDPRYDAGSVRLTSTGKVGTSYRTIDVRVARGGSTDFLYYTDFEDADPENVVVYPGGADPDCGGNGAANGKYWWEKASGYSGTLSPTSATGHRDNCVEIAFSSGDKLDGRVHFNDTPGITGGGTTGGVGYQASFLQGYETADPNCPTNATTNPTRGYCYRYYDYGQSNSGGGKPYFGTSAGAKYAPKLDLPDNSAEFVNYPGCNYWGDTRIRFNSDGTMTVWNTLSNGQTIVNPASPSSLNCGNASNFKPTSGTDPRPAAGQTIPVPNDSVIYVRNSGAANACIPGQVVNGTSSGSTSNDVIPQGSGTAAREVRDIGYYNPDSSTITTTRRFTKSSGATTTSSWSKSTYSQTQTDPNDAHSPKMDCGQGNVYVEGTVKGRVTIAAENNVVVTNNLALASTATGDAPSGTDIVGLVAANSVQVYHPVQRNRTPSNTVGSSNTGVTCNGTNDANPTNAPNGVTSVTCTWTDKYTFGTTYSDITYPGQTNASGNRWIYASIQTLQHSFFVQSYAYGSDQGTLSVRGSIAQRYRGIVRRGTPGYDKDYSYDTRLRFQSPPYFPQWTNASWSAQTTGELKPAYVGS